jgi:hypothetical protein
MVTWISVQLDHQSIIKCLAKKGNGSEVILNGCWLGVVMLPVPDASEVLVQAVEVG